MKLTKIIENLDKIPNKGFEEAPKLTKEQKKRLIEMVGKLSEYAKCIQNEEAIAESAKAIEEISELAGTYACNEASDWFQTDTIKKDFKRAKNISSEYTKMAKECYSRMQQMTALYEDFSHIMERYYDVDAMNEVAPAGWEKTVKGMKKHPEIDNPWALSNWMKGKGYEPQKEEEEPLDQTIPDAPIDQEPDSI